MTTPSPTQKGLLKIAEKIRSGAATPKELLRFTEEVNALLTTLENALRVAK